MSIANDVEKTASFLRQGFAPLAPRVGVILGSGLGAFGDALSRPHRIPFAEVPGLTASSVAGHSGCFVAGYCAEVPLWVMQGRLHLYEGHPVATVVRAIRAMIACGCEVIVVTNAAGGIADSYAAGDLVLITDQINATGHNPLVGDEDHRLGVRFVDMTEAYDPGLRRLAQESARAEGVALKKGVYCGVLGPSYETPAEVRALQRAGADLVGMSTVLEVIAARQMGARVLGISCVTNLAARVGGARLTHDEVKQTAGVVENQLVAVLTRTVAALADPML